MPWSITTIASLGLDTKVVPTFRPDKGLLVDIPEYFNSWVDRLAETCGATIESLDDFLSAMKSRHDFFHKIGGRLRPRYRAVFLRGNG